MTEYWNGMPVKKLRFPRKLWFKYLYYKYIKRLDIIGFYDGIPVIRSNNIELDPEDAIAIQMEQISKIAVQNLHNYLKKRFYKS
jgi:hypothetical protein